MITDKESLNEYLEADRNALKIKLRKPPMFGLDVWKYEIALRHVEYYQNITRGGVLHKLKLRYWRYRFYKLSVLLGFHISPNVCGKGLAISHSGCVVINGKAKIGENCTIQQCVNIGRNHEQDDVPVIGNNVYIGPGAKLFGRIEIADGCAIGAGAVVTKSFTTPNMNIVGNPAHENGVRREGL